MPDKFGYIKRGYDPAEVDSYIDSIEVVLKSYKEKDAAIKNAIVNAQIAADNIVKNAELEASNLKNNAVKHLDTIYQSIMNQKELLRNFQADYNAMLNKYMTTFDSQDVNSVNSSIERLEEYIIELNNEAELTE